MQIEQLEGTDKQLYQLLAPLVMSPEVIHANNNYPFKTNDNYVWFIAMEEENIMGFVPVERKMSKKGIINNYYITAVSGEERERILLALLTVIAHRFKPEEWTLSSITLIQDKETFEKTGFVPISGKWVRYVKMLRQ